MVNFDLKSEIRNQKSKINQMFVHTALTWGFFLALAPLLIHLINLVRRRRVKWAAMEFLQQSYKKHQKWIWLQQMLLLLLRIMAMIVAVAMLAQWMARSQWFSMLSGRVTHHFVLLDDSLSMSERSSGLTAFDRATQTLARIAMQATAQKSPQKMTLIRFSRAAGIAKDEAAASVVQIADLNAVQVDPRFNLLLEEKRRELQVTQLAVGPRRALELANELARLSLDEGHVIHVLSDFRNQDWANPAELKQVLQEIDDATDQIEFVNCATETAQSNLAITDLRPGDEVRAAGVPLSMQVTVTNFGREIARNIKINVRSTDFDPQAMASAEPGKVTGKISEPPAVQIEELAPGQSTMRQIQVFFPSPGQHVVEAALPEDVVHADNQRWCVIDIPDGERVLVIDGDPSTEQGNGYYLTSAFQPGPRAPTGIRVDSKPASFLRDTAPELLATYRAIYLLDVDRLEDRAVENLESFVKAGGGLGVFVGEHVQMAFYTSRLYRNGEGVFPVPLERAEVLPADTEENAPDFEVTNHPIFSVFFGERNPFIRLVTIEGYLRPPLDWTPAPNSTIEVIARLRNRRPLVVERQFGDGRVVVFLTSLKPVWNNWANDPSFVVVLLKLQSYLAAPQRKIDSRIVGSPLAVQLAANTYRPDVTFVTPGAKPELPVILRRTAAPGTDQQLTANLPGLSRDESNTSHSGLYEIWPTPTSGSLEVRRFAFNVDRAESDVSQVSSRTLLTSLSPVRIRMRNSDELAFDMTAEGGLQRGAWLMAFLVVLLLGEQMLAYFASYHPAPATGAVRA